MLVSYNNKYFQGAYSVIHILLLGYMLIKTKPIQWLFTVKLYLLIKDKKRLALGAFYHQLHHRYYECNYGNEEMPWDRWFGTFHDGSQLATEHTRSRKRLMHK